MQALSPFHQTLYLSHLAAGQEYAAFKAICLTARERNPQRGLTGVLLFDGARFCQLVQGPTPAVRALLADIAADRRHERPLTLSDGPIGPHQLRPVWSAGYCDDPQTLDAFEGPDSPRGDAAMATFHAILARAEVWP